MFKRLFSAALVFGAAAIAPPVSAQSPNCMPRDALVSQLAGQYGEHLSGFGVQNPNQVLEIWSSRKTGTFTVVITRSDGISCVMAVGENWSEIAPPVPPDMAG